MIGGICLKFLFFIGAVLSFADPITDGLTCYKYLENGNILWFVLCLVFIILPSVVYLIFWLFILPSDESTTSGKVLAKLRCCILALCCPFIPCCGKLYVAFTTKKHEDHQLYIEVFNCLEVGIQLAPQFILQFYAAMVQTKDVSPIQIVSLTLTFLRIGWCYANINEDCTFKLCFAGLVSVAARVFAYSLFAVALGPWVILVIGLHMMLTAVIQRSHRVRAFGYVCLSWLSYTPLGSDKESDEERLKWTSRTFVQPIIHVIEDIIMAIFYYFFVEDGRTYPYRLRIMLGIIGASVFGYFVLRISRFVKCRGEEEPIDLEAGRGLNAPETDVNASRKEVETADGKSRFGFGRLRSKRPNSSGNETAAVEAVADGSTVGKDSGRSGKLSLWKFGKGKEKNDRESQGGGANDEGTRGGFVGFRKLRNLKLERTKKQEGNVS